MGYIIKNITYYLHMTVVCRLEQVGFKWIFVEPIEYFIIIIIIINNNNNNNNSNNKKLP